MKLLAVLTTFNRRAQTVACLQALQSNAAHAGVQLQAIVVDDASSDGTAQAVRDSFAWAQVVPSEGNLYWNRAMYRGMALALAQAVDHVLWLNDDTLLQAGVLARLLQQSGQLQQQLGQPRWRDQDGARQRPAGDPEHGHRPDQVRRRSQARDRGGHPDLPGRMREPTCKRQKPGLDQGGHAGRQVLS